MEQTAIQKAIEKIRGDISYLATEREGFRSRKEFDRALMCTERIMQAQADIRLLKSSLPTESEHTKQVGTGFDTWKIENEWKHYDYEDGVNYYVKVGNPNKLTGSQLWEEYILTLQNKKG